MENDVHKRWMALGPMEHNVTVAIRMATALSVKLEARKKYTGGSDTQAMNELEERFEELLKEAEVTAA